MKILANDGISDSGKEKLEEYGFDVDLTKVSQEQLVSYINENEISTILVRSATQVRADIIDKNFIDFTKNQNTNTRKGILQSYDQLLNNKYQVQLNQKTIDRVKEYFK